MGEEIESEKGVQGQNDEMNELVAALFDKVIPRLLRPLETGGRSIKPSLCHGDLWHGNVGVDVAADEPILYDPCAIYAHNECECSVYSSRGSLTVSDDMSSWRSDRYRFNREHRDAYHKIIPPSEPVEDYDDRNALYALYVSRTFWNAGADLSRRNNITVSAQWPHNKTTRKL